MHYYLYKLEFPYGVHFGAEKAGIWLEKISANCHCDTLYSAICLEILKLYGEDKLSEFYQETYNGNFLFSDLLPYNGDELMIPKPILFQEKSADEQVADSVKKKKMKKLKFLPISKIKEFFEGNVEEMEFATTALYDKNSPARNGDATDNGLYSVAITRFLENCGLYFIVKMEANKKVWFDNVLKSLALSGLGGKRTSGYGQFEIVDDFEISVDSGITSEKILADALNKKQADYYLSLSLIYPKKEEIHKIKDGYYSLIQRQGFVQSLTYSDVPLKKIPVTMINAGSCFKEVLDGEIIDVSKDGAHSVYRYGKPIMIGIDL